MTGLYLDNSYPYASTNIQLAGGAYLRDDGQVQGSYCTFETRDLIRRGAVVAHLQKKEKVLVVEAHDLRARLVKPVE